MTAPAADGVDVHAGPQEVSRRPSIPCEARVLIRHLESLPLVILQVQNPASYQGFQHYSESSVAVAISGSGHAIVHFLHSE